MYIVILFAASMYVCYFQSVILRVPNESKNQAYPTEGHVKQKQ